MDLIPHSITIKQEEEIEIIDIHHQDPLETSSEDFKDDGEAPFDDDPSLDDEKPQSTFKSSVTKLFYICEVCGFKLQSLRYMQRHLTSKYHKKQCKRKGIKCEGEQMLEDDIKPAKTQQVKVPQPEVSFRCEECGKGFSMRCHYTQHMKIIHSADPMPYKCTKCGKKFKEMKFLNYHALQHEKPKPFKCDECPKAYLLKFDLTRHMRYHNKKNMHHCEICKRAFPRRDHLQKHYRSHEKKEAKKSMAMAVKNDTKTE